MKNLIIVLSAACAVVAYYFGLRYFSGRDLGFTPAKKSEQGLLLYSESLAGSTDPDESRPMMCRLKSSAGWRR
jgi:hypothetical protein